jgi:hypothetical protein
MAKDRAEFGATKIVGLVWEVFIRKVINDRK